MTFKIERILPRTLTGREIEMASDGVWRIETISLEEFKRRYGMELNRADDDGEYFYDLRRLKPSP